MRRFLVVLFACLRRTCPVCLHGRMFRSHFTLNVRCPNCGVIYERAAGELSGGMAINTVVTLSIAISGAFLALFTSIDIGALIGILVALVIVFPIWFYPYARALWIGLLYLTGSIREE